MTTAFIGLLGLLVGAFLTAMITAVWLALHAYELVQWREARARSRSMLASS